MKKALVLVVLALTFNAAAQDYKGHYGIGLALGEPSGFSIKKFNNNNEAFQYTLGYSAVKGQEGINIGADYLLHNYEIITAEKGRIPFYYGGGVHLKSYNERGTNSTPEFLWEWLTNLLSFPLMCSSNLHRVLRYFHHLP